MKSGARTSAGPTGWRSAWLTSASLLGLVLLVASLFGLIAVRDGPGSAPVARWPSHGSDFDVRTGVTAEPTALTAPPTVPHASSAPRAIPVPLGVSVPSVGIRSELIPLGLNPDSTLQVPEDFGVAGWYTGRPVPGEPGPSVIVGHVDSKRGPAVFYRLDEVGPGAMVEVARSDGTTARFAVVAKEQHDKDAFPTDRVYGPTDSSQLRLITCGGSFDRSVGHYTDNVIVFAELVDVLSNP
jgi:sortase (surface protein transpeptidase)